MTVRCSKIPAAEKKYSSYIYIYSSYGDAFGDYKIEPMTMSVSLKINMLLGD